MVDGQHFIKPMDKLDPREQPQDQVYPDDIRRNDKGRRAIKRVVQKACDLDRLAFPQAPTFDPATQECTVAGKVKMTMQEFVRQSPTYFQFAYLSLTNPEAYGRRVHSDLTRVLAGLRAEKPCRKEFLALLSDLRSARLAGKLEV